MQPDEIKEWAQRIGEKWVHAQDQAAYDLVQELVNKIQQDGDGDEIRVESGVSYPKLEPFVHILWGQLRCQLSPEEARQHALIILGAADAAEGDAFLMRFAKEKIKLSDQAAAQLLVEFRSHRSK